MGGPNVGLPSWEELADDFPCNIFIFLEFMLSEDKGLLIGDLPGVRTKVLLDFIRSTLIHFSIAATCFPLANKDTIDKLKNTITRLKSKISVPSIENWPLKTATFRISMN